MTQAGLGVSFGLPTVGSVNEIPNQPGSTGGGPPRKLVAPGHAVQLVLSTVFETKMPESATMSLTPRSFAPFHRSHMRPPDGENDTIVSGRFVRHADTLS